MRAQVGCPEELTSEDVKFCLVFPREPLSVPVMRHVLGDTLRGLGADDEVVADLLLAVSEACTNVLRHGGPGRRYEVLATVDAAGCLVEVVNTGRMFDPGSVPGMRLRRSLRPGAPAVIRIRPRMPWPAAAGWRERRPGLPGRQGRPGREGRPARLGRPGRTGWTVWPGRQARDEELAAVPESGRGLAIIRACVDDVTLRTGPESGTVVSLQKRIAWRGGAPLARMPGELKDAG